MSIRAHSSSTAITVESIVIVFYRYGIIITYGQVKWSNVYGKRNAKIFQRHVILAYTYVYLRTYTETKLVYK